MNIQASLSALVAAAALLSAPAQAATCSDTFNLGLLGPSGSAFLYNGFSAPQRFNDCYNFSLSSPANSAGSTTQWDFSWARDIDLTSVSLTGPGLSKVDSSPESFSFSNLLAGSYQLIVSGIVTGNSLPAFLGGTVGYFGSITATRSIAAPVPEPETYAMLALGLAIVGWTAKRTKKSR